LVYSDPLSGAVGVADRNAQRSWKTHEEEYAYCDYVAWAAISA